MGYHHVDPATLESTPDHPCERRPISDGTDLAVLHLARYTLEPGEQLPRTYHYHEHREEAFYVLSGQLHVETPDEEFVVTADETFVVDPGSPHRPYNPADAPAATTVLGTGAPATDPAIPYEPDGEDPNGTH